MMTMANSTSTQWIPLLSPSTLFHSSSPNSTSITQLPIRPIFPLKPRKRSPILCLFQFPNPPQNPISPKPAKPSVIAFAGRSKKKPGGPSPGRIEGNAEIRREAKKNAQRRMRRGVDRYFFNKNSKSSRNQADEFTEGELEMIGLGYDRQVRFMEPDDPGLRHPYDWYKYGEFGPYSWRGVVVGEPIRGRFSDERVSIYSEVKDHEEFEMWEQFDMVNDFSRRMKQLESSLGLRTSIVESKSKFSEHNKGLMIENAMDCFWVFVRHPHWKSGESPWNEWTLVSEVVVETKGERLNKWNLMGRLGNKARELVTKCAAWFRPDILYVKRPIYQCRFEPQRPFFQGLVPMLDPETDANFAFEFSGGMCTYFGGLCKIVRVNPKAFVDDVVNAYEKLDEEKKSECLEFLLHNHPIQLLHPYTKEWKAKLEEMELGCDAPDSDEEDEGVKMDFTEWIDDDKDDENDDDVDEYEDEDDEEEEEEEEDSELGIKDEDVSKEDKDEFWDEEFEKAIRNPEAMERLVTRSMEASNERYRQQMEWMKNEEERAKVEKAKELEVNGVGILSQIRGESIPSEKGQVGLVSRRLKKERVAPELFLRAAVRPFTYKNLVKEIVLLRHRIIEEKEELSRTA